MTELWNYNFQVMLGHPDVWGLAGNVVNHPRFPDWAQVTVSRPVDFDEENNYIITVSGRMYELRQPAGDRKIIHDEIRAVIRRGCYETA